MGMLSAEQIAFYHEHGYLHIPNVFTKDETTVVAPTISDTHVGASLTGRF